MELSLPYRNRWFQVLVVCLILCIMYLYYRPRQTHFAFRVLLFIAARLDSSNDKTSSEYRAFRWLLQFRPRNQPYSLKTLRWVVSMTDSVLPPIPQGTMVEQLTDWPHNNLTSQAIKPANVGADAPILLYLHGGAFCAGSASAAQSIACRFGTAWGCRVLNVDYRLAPEHKMPAALHDCQTAYLRLVRDNPTTPIIVAGDSAGGGLALLLLQWIAKWNATVAVPIPRPRCGVLISPYADLTHSSRSIRENQTNDFLLGFDDDRMLKQIQQWVIPQTLGAGNPKISALYGSFKSLPPLLITCSDQEMLYDDARACADAARDADVMVRLHIERGSCHVYPVFAGIFPEANPEKLDPRIWFGSAIMHQGLTNNNDMVTTSCQEHQPIVC